MSLFFKCKQQISHERLQIETPQVIFSAINIIIIIIVG